MKTRAYGTYRLLAAVALMIALCVAAWGIDATIIETTGDVELQQPGATTWEAVEPGMIVPTGATISTSFNATARIEIGASVVVVSPLTRMRIDELVSRDGTDSSELFLRVGRLRADVRGTDGNQADFQVRSPIATASVRGTTFVFDGANLDVSTGIVRLENRFSEGVSVGGGESSSSTGEAAPRPPVEVAEDNATVEVRTGPVDQVRPERPPATGGLTITWEVEQP